MAEPIISFFESNNTTGYDDETNPVDHGSINAGTSGNPVQINIWNNKGGGSAVADAENATFGIVTMNGLTVGDTIENGKEIVEGEWMLAKVVGDPTYNAIGGVTTLPLGTIAGDINGDSVEVEEMLSIPPNATPGAVSWLHRVTYQYTE